jgi:hypothetical protein
VSITLAMSTTVAVALPVEEVRGAATLTSSSAAWMLTTDIAVVGVAPAVMPVLALAVVALYRDMLTAGRPGSLIVQLLICGRTTHVQVVGMPATGG